MLLSVTVNDLYDYTLLNGVNVNTFLDMGGYAAFVWPSFSLSAFVLIGVAVMSVRSLKTARATLLRLEEENV